MFFSDFLLTVLKVKPCLVPGSYQNPNKYQNPSPKLGHNLVWFRILQRLGVAVAWIACVLVSGVKQLPGQAGSSAFGGVSVLSLKAGAQLTGR